MVFPGWPFYGLAVKTRLTMLRDVAISYLEDLRAGFFTSFSEVLPSRASKTTPLRSEPIRAFAANLHFVNTLAGPKNVSNCFYL